ncbi:ABC transporter permease [Anaerolentibacter hominis]|uniref:ABC transporter permease n=1 Tax=Anaerolentibacter hominis TaxID=3079009 RepID=UPI0031B87033
MKNNNKKAVRRLSARSRRENKARNLFIILAIVLTTVLFTSVLTMGFGMMSSMEQETMRQIGTSAHAGFKDLTGEQYDRIRENGRIKKISYEVLLGEADNPELAKRSTEIRYGEPDDIQWGFRTPETGTLPEGKMDILVDTIVLDMLGLPHEIGTKLTLAYTFLGNQISDEFTVCGIYEGDPILGASQVYLSKEYVEEICSRVPEQERKQLADNGKSNGEGLIQANVFFSESSGIEENAKEVLRECGFQDNEIQIGVNWAYLSTKTEGADPIFFLGVGIVFLLIGFTGYLVIYNIFRISIVNDIRFYGLLKTIGTTGRQIRSLIRRQAFFLSMVGIPIGLLAGWLLGLKLTPVLMRAVSGTYGNGFSANPWIFLGATVFSMLTVWISCRRPGRIAASVSPVEAVKYVEAAGGKPGRAGKRVHGAKIGRLALENLSRNKKKTAAVIASMTLSMILLLVVYTLATGFSMERYLDEMMKGDINIGTTDFFHNYGMGEIEVPEDYYQYAAGLEGVEREGKGYVGFFTHYLDERGQSSLKNALENGFLSSSPQGLKQAYEAVLGDDHKLYETRLAFDDYLLEQITVLEGELDLEKFKEGGYVLEAAKLKTKEGKSAYHRPGDKITLNYYDKEDQYEKEAVYDGSTGKEIDLGINKKEPAPSELPAKEYEVMAVVELEEGLVSYMGGTPGITVVVPKEDLVQMSKVSGYQTYLGCFEVEDSREASVAAALENYTTSVNPGMEFRSRDSLRKEFAGIVGMFWIVGGALCAVVGLVGILNYVNAVFTGILSRKRELAMLKSIGMTDRQQKKMLCLEGFYYIGFTALLSLSLGTLLSLVIFRSFQEIMRWFVYRFTLLPILVCLPVFAVIAVLVPVFLYSRMNRESIVDRLRE